MFENGVDVMKWGLAQRSAGCVSWYAKLSGISKSHIMTPYSRVLVFLPSRVDIKPGYLCEMLEQKPEIFSEGHEGRPVLSVVEYWDPKVVIQG